MTKWCIYALIDPRTAEVRYIGWTVNLEQRLRDHTKASALESKQHRAKWIKSLIAQGLRPHCRILEEGEGSGWADAERQWIAAFRLLAANLTNHTDGGEGTPGRRHTPESCAKMSATRKGRFPAAAMAAYIAKHKGEKRSPEMIEKLAAGLRGKPKSEAHRRALADSLRGRKLSAERRAAISARMTGSKRGPMSEAQKKQLSDARKGTPQPQIAAWWASQTPEERSERARERWRKRKMSAALP